MTSRIARSIAGMAAAAAIALLGVGATGSAAAQSSPARFAERDGLTNRYEPPVSEIDVGRGDQ